MLCHYNREIAESLGLKDKIIIMKTLKGKPSMRGNRNKINRKGLQIEMAAII